jgi:Ca2+-transporting ATPase
MKTSGKVTVKKRISFEKLRDTKRSTSGLSGAEAAAQLARYGTNAIVESEENHWFTLLSETAKDPMIWFLVGIAAVFFLVGDRREATILLLATIPLLFMDAFLHWRTRASTAALRGQLAAEALVLRDGERRRIGSHEIVPGDLVVLSAEDQFLPADGYWEVADALLVDESVLTGEAFPIAKYALRIETLPSTTGDAVAEEQNLGFAGTRVLTGSGLLRVILTGKETSYGEIVRSVAAVTHERTVLQIAITKLTKALVYVAAVLCLILAVVRFWQGFGWLDALLSAATLAVAAIPEEFPVVFTFFLGVGVYRLAKRHALVRRAVSVENIGRVTRICTDKTGTITVGELKLTHLDAAALGHAEELLAYAGAASNPEGTDPVDLAIRAAAVERNVTLPRRESALPFTEDRKRETAFFADRGRAVCAMKGSPETIISRSSLADDDRRKWLARTETWAREGHKVLAVGFRELTEAELRARAEPASGLHFAGLLAFEDPARPEVRPAVAYCDRSGIRVLMLTGDHPQTAAAIAKDVGLGQGRPVVVSAEATPEAFAATAEASALADFLRNVHVVARCTPMQKLRIVEALRATGDLVAVTGDGVNDVPALKAADIGVAMGIRGSRSAKEVAAIILSNDNFSTIVAAIQEGRQLFANLRRSFEYLLLLHIPFVVSAAVVPLLGHPLLYLPAHVVWLELLIHPTALLAFQGTAEADSGAGPERRTSFFDARDAAHVLVVGAAVTAALVGTYVADADPDRARAKAMALLSFWSAALAVYLTGGRPWAAIAIAAASVTTTFVLVEAPWAAEPLHLGRLDLGDWAAVCGVILGAVTLLSVLRASRLRAESRATRGRNIPGHG